MPSRKIQVSHAAGANLYIVVRDRHARTWDGQAFDLAVPLSQAAIAMSWLGGNLYSAELPHNMPYGRKVVMVYHRAGAEPAATDTVLKTVVLEWPTN